MGFSFGFGARLFLLNAGCAGAGNPESKIARQEGRKAGSCSAGEKVHVLCLTLSWLLLMEWWTYCRNFQLFLQLSVLCGAVESCRSLP